MHPCGYNAFCLHPGKHYLDALPPHRSEDPNGEDGGGDVEDCELEHVALLELCIYRVYMLL